MFHQPKVGGRSRASVPRMCASDAATWLGVLRKERSIVWAIIRGKVRVAGGLAKLKDFGRCFPG